MDFDHDYANYLDEKGVAEHIVGHQGVGAGLENRAQLFLGLFSLRDVLADGLEFPQAPVRAEGRHIGPFMPAKTSVRGFHAVLMRMNRVFPAQAEIYRTGLFFFFRRQKIKPASADQLRFRLLEVVGIGPVDICQRSIRQESADQGRKMVQDIVGLLGVLRLQQVQLLGSTIFGRNSHAQFLPLCFLPGIDRRAAALWPVHVIAQDYKAI